MGSDRVFDLASDSHLYMYMDSDRWEERFNMISPDAGYVNEDDFEFEMDVVFGDGFKVKLVLFLYEVKKDFFKFIFSFNVRKIIVPVEESLSYERFVSFPVFAGYWLDTDSNDILFIFKANKIFSDMFLRNGYKLTEDTFNRMLYWCIEGKKLGIGGQHRMKIEFVKSKWRLFG